MMMGTGLGQEGVEARSRGNRRIGPVGIFDHSGDSFRRLVHLNLFFWKWGENGGYLLQFCKHGLLGLMRSVATDGGPYGITSNAVLPGWVRTEMAERSARQEAKDRGITTDLVWKERAASYPPGRVATPQEVAEMVAFLASEESSGVSGEAIKVALGSMS